MKILFKNDWIEIYLEPEKKMKNLKFGGWLFDPQPANAFRKLSQG